MLLTYSVNTNTFTSALAYDDSGRRTNLTLPNGIKVFYRYDAASRLTNLTYQTAVTNSIAYSYDDAGNRHYTASQFGKTSHAFATPTRQGSDGCSSGITSDLDQRFRISWFSLSSIRYYEICCFRLWRMVGFPCHAA